MLIYDEYRKAVDKLQNEMLDLDERINYRKLELRKVNLASTPLTPTGLERLENIYDNDEELAKLKYKNAAVKLKLDYLRANGDLPD